MSLQESTTAASNIAKINAKRTAIAVAAAIASLAAADATRAAALVWGGAGSDNNWSTLANWTGAAAIPANTDTLTFAGSTRLTPNNDIAGLVLGSNSITFAATAGSFDIGGLGMTLGASSGTAYDVITKVSTNDQTISANLTLGGGGGDRRVVMTGGGTLTLSGNLNFSNSWLFPNTTPGTIRLSGNNSGDGRGSVITAGTNQLRATIGNNVANTQLVLGSDTALGNAGLGDLTSGGATLRGVQARQNTLISTIGNRNLSAYTIAINTANVTFNGTSNMTIGHILNQGGNRDFVVSSSGAVTVSSGLIMSQDQTGRALYVNLTGTGGLTVNGKLFDTMHSGGLTTGSSILRKAGAASLTLNGDSSNYLGEIRIEGGTLLVGHANALGASDPTLYFTSIRAGTLDLNGFTVAEKLWSDNADAVLANSSATAAAVTTDISLSNNLTINATGNITLPRLIATAIRTVNKNGPGTLTTNGTNHNSLTSWNVNAGTVVFANTAGRAADRGLTLAGGTVRLSGPNSDLISDSQPFVINAGTFDLNGKSEAVASIDGTGGTVTTSIAGAATLFVGGGVAGSSSGTWAGTIQDGAGQLNLTKEGTGTQTLSSAQTYTGVTTISNGTLALVGTASIGASPTIAVGGSGTLDVAGVTGGFTLLSTQTLSGTGSVVGDVDVLGTIAPGASIGTLNTNDLQFLAGSAYQAEIDTSLSSSDLIAMVGNLSISGAPTLLVSDLAPVPASLGVGTTLTLVTYTGTWNGGTFAGLADGASFILGPNQYQIDYDTITGSGSAVTLTVTLIPEPTVLGSMAAMGAILLRRRGR